MYRLYVANKDNWKLRPTILGWNFVFRTPENEIIGYENFEFTDCMISVHELEEEVATNNYKWVDIFETVDSMRKALYTSSVDEETIRYRR